MTNQRGLEYGVLRITAEAVPVDTSVSLLEFLLENKIENALELINLGSIYLNEKRETNSSVEVKQNDQVRIHSQPRRFRKPSDLRNRIIEENEHYILFDKPAGLPVHSLVDNCRENLLAFLENELGISLFITHRLDTETSGRLLIAKTMEAQSEINRRFRDRLINKNYVAEVQTRVEPGTYIHFMKPTHGAPKEVSKTEQDAWLRCELKVIECKELAPDKFALEIELITGRPQQIRAQLAALGSPIIGDTKYGSPIKLVEDSSVIALRCSKLEFSTPFRLEEIGHGDIDAGD
jgi:23S rRNA-/tRNA-specific pseudouridylate synthase